MIIQVNRKYCVFFIISSVFCLSVFVHIRSRWTITPDTIITLIGDHVPASRIVRCGI
nr:MAG TPA: hypothetical protein [Caudoviricetes sp.]